MLETIRLITSIEVFPILGWGIGYSNPLVSFRIPGVLIAVDSEWRSISVSLESENRMFSDPNNKRI